MTSPLPPFHTSTPKDSGARPKIHFQGARSHALDDSLYPDFVALEKEPDSMNEKEMDREFQELTACYERVKNEYEKRKSVHRNKSAKLGDHAFVDNGARIDQKVTFEDSAQGSPVGLGASSHSRETDTDALQRQIKELERQELELFIALHRSQLDAYKSVADTSSQIGTTQTARTTPTQLGTLHSLPSERSNRFTSVDTSRVNRSDHSQPVRKEKEPDKFDGRSVEWKYFIVHFEQVSSWNKWSYHVQGQ